MQRILKYDLLSFLPDINEVHVYIKTNNVCSFSIINFLESMQYVSVICSPPPHNLPLGEGDQSRENVPGVLFSNFTKGHVFCFVSKYSRDYISCVMRKHTFCISENKRHRSAKLSPRSLSATLFSPQKVQSLFSLNANAFSSSVPVQPACV